MAKTAHEIIKEVSPYYKKKGPKTENKLVYESSTETLEPLYFWILDFLQDQIGFKVEKLSDNFSSSPGSGHFSELGNKASIMQQQGSKLMGDINTVIRSILNLLYDLKEFKIRLESYENLKSKEDAIKDAAELSLKQIWLDKVDFQKGNSSIKAMALSQAGFITLIDAFLASKDEKSVAKLDLNDRVKRIILPRIKEFKSWIIESELELRKRYELEKNYLKSQVNSLKLYSRWVAPYLRAAKKLEMKDSDRNPNLVNVFNTLILELTLFAKSEKDLKKLAQAGDFPRSFLNYNQRRKYYSCILIDITFRGIPQKAGQHYVFGGRTEVTFTSYALNDQEIDKFMKEYDKNEFGEVLEWIENATGQSLKQIQKEIDSFLEDKKESKKEEKKNTDTSNPILALLGFYNKKPEKKEESKKPKKEEKIISDDWVEKYLREKSESDAGEMAFLVYDIYKKAHGMSSYT